MEGQGVRSPLLGAPPGSFVQRDVRAPSPGLFAIKNQLYSCFFCLVTRPNKSLSVPRAEGLNIASIVFTFLIYTSQSDKDRNN